MLHAKSGKPTFAYVYKLKLLQRLEVKWKVSKKITYMIYFCLFKSIRCLVFHTQHFVLIMQAIAATLDVRKSFPILALRHFFQH